MTRSVTARLLRLDAALSAIEARKQARKAASDLAQRLIALGVEPDKARKAADKAQRNGCGLCMAKNRQGLPCIALGAGAGGRCRFHGGASTGPKTPEGMRRALDALARAVAKRRSGGTAGRDAVERGEVAGELPAKGTKKRGAGCGGESQREVNALTSGRESQA